ncbi:phosphoenolpyruvate carboxylase [Limnobacter sp.]|uniref:phosphoenolpyruvate carboxylase n=2 Tax=Limnobacter sp. TaxID=2003368 RepID=UPI00355AACFE
MYSAVNLSTNDLTQASALIEAPPCATPNAHCPNTHLKTLALQDAPHAAKKQLGELLEALESLPPEQAAQGGELAKQFVARYKDQADVMACVFKYLNCRLMLNHAKLSSPSTSPAALASPGTLQLHLGPRLDHTKPIIGPVLTSHPTQLNQPRGTLLALNSAAAQPQTEAEAMALAENLWELAGPRNERPTVLDEASALTPVLSNVLQSIRKNTKALMQEINQHGELKSPAQLQAGNWVGGDRDGNPTITPELLREVMGLWSEVAFEQYLHKVSGSDAEARPGSLYTLFKIAGHGQELDGLANKIMNTRDHVLGKRELLPNEEKFNSPADLAAHVSKLKTQLNWEGLHPALQQRVAQKLDQLTMWANTFGFHGASTHIRQNSEVNQQTVHALLQAVDPRLDYASLDEQSKVKVLNKVLNSAPGFELPSSVKSANPEIQKEIKFLESYKDLRTRFGADALPNIITANTETLSDMLEVCVLLKYAEIGRASCRERV